MCTVFLNFSPLNVLLEEDNGLPNSNLHNETQFLEWSFLQKFHLIDSPIYICYTVSSLPLESLGPIGKHNAEGPI